MVKKSIKAPIYRTISDRGGQFFVNIAEVPAGRAELYRSGGAGELIPVADIQVPEDMRINPDPKEFREHVKKEIRKIENYVKAKTEFDQSNIEMRIDEAAAVEKGLISLEDGRKTPKNALPESKQTKKTKKKEAKMGRPGFFKGVDFDS